MLLLVVGFALLVYCMGLAGVDVELSRGRVAACLLAGAVFLTLVLVGEPPPRWHRLGYLYLAAAFIPFFALTLIWFGDELGSDACYPTLGVPARYSTPGVALRVLGWLFLIVAGVLTVWVVVLTSQR
jgi:hypothetical protein